MIDLEHLPDVGDPRLPTFFDELPIWSAPFGLALLDLVTLRPGIAALDIGPGTGFPALELAQRLGSTASVIGVDPWGAALEWASARATFLGLDNVRLVEGAAEALPLADGSIDLIVSNNGLNNVADLERVLGECARVARPGCELVMTANGPASMRPLYDALEAVVGADDAAIGERVAAHIDARRKPLSFWREALDRHGFVVAAVHEAEFALRFADAAAMFAHPFMRLAFVPGWLALVPEGRRVGVFEAVARRLPAPVSLPIPFFALRAVR